MTSKSKEFQTPGAELDEPASPAKAAVAAKPRDPVVSALVLAALSIVILALSVVVYAVATGVFGTGAPRTMGEKRIMAASAKIEGGSKAREDWTAYILALTADGQYRKAQEWIDKGEKTLEDQDIYADMLYMQADLAFAQGDTDQSLKLTEQALKQIKDRYEQGKESAAQTGKPDAASAYGLVDTYWNVLLLQAEIYEGKKDWKNALKVYDEYLAQQKTAATVFALRGVVKENLGDKKGAEADYRQTIAFIPDNVEALAGLKRIGATQ